MASVGNFFDLVAPLINRCQNFDSIVIDVKILTVSCRGATKCAFFAKIDPTLAIFM